MASVAATATPASFASSARTSRRRCCSEHSPPAADGFDQGRRPRALAGPARRARRSDDAARARAARGRRATESRRGWRGPRRPRAGSTRRARGSGASTAPAANAAGSDPARPGRLRAAGRSSRRRTRHTPPARRAAGDRRRPGCQRRQAGAGPAAPASGSLRFPSGAAGAAAASSATSVRRSPVAIARLWLTSGAMRWRCAGNRSPTSAASAVASSCRPCASMRADARLVGGDDERLVLGAPRLLEPLLGELERLAASCRRRSGIRCEPASPGDSSAAGRSGDGLGACHACSMARTWLWGSAADATAALGLKSPHIMGSATPSCPLVVATDGVSHVWTLDAPFLAVAS